MNDNIGVTCISCIEVALRCKHNASLDVWNDIHEKLHTNQNFIDHDIIVHRTDECSDHRDVICISMMPRLNAVFVDYAPNVLFKVGNFSIRKDGSINCGTHLNGETPLITLSKDLIMDIQIKVPYYSIDDQKNIIYSESMHKHYINRNQ